MIADGDKGTIIAIGSPNNKLAQYFVRLDDGKGDLWFSREEVVPESYQGKKNGG